MQYCGIGIIVNQATKTNGYEMFTTRKKIKETPMYTNIGMKRQGFRIPFENVGDWSVVYELPLGVKNAIPTKRLKRLD